MAKKINYKREVGRIIDLLYLDIDDEGDFFNKDKEWNGETIERVAEVVLGTFKFKGTDRNKKVVMAEEKPVKVAVSVSGGVLAEVVSSAPLDVVLVDHDNLDEDVDTDLVWEKASKGLVPQEIIQGGV